MKIKRNGFVLVEALISIVIMSLLGIAISEQIKTTARVQDKTKQTSESIEDAARVLMILKRDLLQVTNRPVRTKNAQESAFIGANVEMAFTKSGWPNPLNLNRSTNQRVHWSLIGNNLKRTYYSTLDRPDSEEKIVQSFDGVSKFEISYLDQNLSKVKSWDSSESKSTPVAAEIVLQLIGSPSLTMLVEIPSLNLLDKQTQ